MKERRVREREHHRQIEREKREEREEEREMCERARRKTK